MQGCLLGLNEWDSVSTDDANISDDELLCHCMRVERGRIVAAIRNGAESVEDLQIQTSACTGCGTCRWDLEELIAAIRAEQNRRRDT